MASREFEQMPFAERNQLMIDYLYSSSKQIYDCVLHTKDTKKCFSFKDDVIYAKKVYREEDMVMKYPHQYNLVETAPRFSSGRQWVHDSFWSAWELVFPGAVFRT